MFLVRGISTWETSPSRIGSRVMPENKNIVKNEPLNKTLLEIFIDELSESSLNKISTLTKMLHTKETLREKQVCRLMPEQVKHCYKRRDWYGQKDRPTKNI
jgi:hypothetical protein